MAKRVGCVIVFKPGTSKTAAAAALESLHSVVDFPAVTSQAVYAPDTPGSRVRRITRFDHVPFKTEHVLNEFEDEHGSPVFYIP